MAGTTAAVVLERVRKRYGRGRDGHPVAKATETWVPYVPWLPALITVTSVAALALAASLGPFAVLTRPPNPSPASSGRAGPCSTHPAVAP